ncbi:MAG TPA: HAD-IA family hydrolase, partial [Vicinamibacterales bacterium]|nr:HAD-IA family hydrolase [Vicinamibacterales bacterium]
STGVVTNNVASEQRQKIAACGFGPLRDAVIISEEEGVAKPDPRIFSLALETLGAEAGKTVMIGDAWETDIAGARAAGVHPIWFNRLGAASPDRRVTEIQSLVPVGCVLSLIFPSP